MRLSRKKMRRNLAVSEIMGTIIMLGIATSNFGVISYYFLSAPNPNPQPIVEMSGVIEDNQIIVTHHGGEPLDLDTEVVLKFGGESKSLTVGEFLDEESKEDGVWGLSEKFVYLPDYDFDFLDYPEIQINVIDLDSNSMLLNGLTKVNPTCDIGVELEANTTNPKEFENVEIILTIFNYGNINVSGVSIDFKLPAGLSYFSSVLDQGSYNSTSGVLYIDHIERGESLTFKMVATVGDVINGEPTQLVILLDGSGSISPDSWKLMLEGVAAAVNDESRFSHSGVMELTIIQFGGKSPAYAQLEIGPIVITTLNVNSVINDILKIKQIGDKTPTNCAIKMAADKLKDSDMFEPGIRQVVLLVTDGNPTHACDCEDDDYTDAGDKTVGPKDAVIEAVNYLVDKLNLNEDNDELNCLAVELTGTGHNIEMLDMVAWPKPGYFFPDQYSEDNPSGGWVRNVSSWQEFADSINESFEIMFNTLEVLIRIDSRAFSDPKTANDITRIELKPAPSFIDLKKAEISAKEITKS